ncbi:hypothetical protein MLD38_027470 [Melastoma candidum]|uniref:Uncharacterized protein n=1 Tax=Melastoma candidum TaxID=119954 RepID=A0ACB9P3G6_9MYRT|nr:hypothetical protein MLD38_027470 [Melastoma candidum]
MGFISRRIFPACGKMCVCCPALRSRSRHPVKRYKKLLADIFPKGIDGPTSDRKIVKLCEYASKNPFRIPKIVKYLEERCYKELRNDHPKFINIVEIYNKLLCKCKGQMVYFAISLLDVVSQLLDNGKQDALQILGCQTLGNFILSQSDSMYAHNIEKFVHKVCALARVRSDGHQNSCLRASGLQCIAAMVGFMVKFSTVFDSFDKIVEVTLENYQLDIGNENSCENGELHNWVDEVVRSEGRAAGDSSPNCIIFKKPPERKDPVLLTKEEMENAKVWAEICLQRMADLASESTTSLRRVVDPMFTYFDSGSHWTPRQGLAYIVLSDFTYFLDTTGNQQLVLASLIRHLDHKNVSHDPLLKASDIRVATALLRQIRPRAVLCDMGFITDLSRHLRKSLQSTIESVGEQELNDNRLLQKSIEDCFVEAAKGISDARPLFDLLAITLEKIPTPGVPARATIGSAIVLAHMTALVAASSNFDQVFPEAILVQLLSAMLHSDIEVRVGAHHIFSIILTPNSSNHRHEVSRTGGICVHEPGKPSTASTLASITARLQKLTNEKNGAISEKTGFSSETESQGMEHYCKNRNQGHPVKQPTNFCYAPITAKATDACFLKLNEDQIGLLLSGFWIQANLPNNLPSNFEAITHSFCLTLQSSHAMSSYKNLIVRIFHLALSLRNLALGDGRGMLSPACRRSLLTVSGSMLMFASYIHQMFDLIDLLKSTYPFKGDPYLGIDEDFKLYLKPNIDGHEYGSFADNQIASSLLQSASGHNESEVIMGKLIKSLSSISELDEEDLARQLSEEFTPDDAYMLGPNLTLDADQKQVIFHSKNSLSFDKDFSQNSASDEDTQSEASYAGMHLSSRTTSTPPSSSVIGVAQLMETALVVAGEVAGTAALSSPLPYDFMASQCEALGNDPRRKLSNWLTHECHECDGVREGNQLCQSAGGGASLPKVTGGELILKDRSLVMKLPPASPFDNFLKAADAEKMHLVVRTINSSELSGYHFVMHPGRLSVSRS